MTTQLAPARQATAALDTNGRPARPGLARRATAEDLAAFALLFAGCGAMANAEYGAP